MTVLEQVQDDARTAMKARDRERASALRMVVDVLQQDAKLGKGDEVAEALDVTRAEEAVLPLPVPLGQEPPRLEQALRGGRDRVAGGDQADVAPEHPLQHRGDQRVVGAAEDQRVDLGPVQRCAVEAHLLDDLLTELGAALDDSGEVGS